MIDLHLHLDGSLPPKTVITLAKRQGIPLPAQDETALLPYLRAPSDCRDLNEYLKRFDLPLSVLQTEEALCFALISLLNELEAEGLLYAEIRFAPQLHTKAGIHQERIVQAALAGLIKGLFGKTLRARLILCAMRGNHNARENEETVELAAAYAKEGVCAVDLAGAEALFETARFAPVFQKAKRLGVPITIHAGEAAGPKSVWQALHLGAKRIGHGVFAKEDPALLKTLEQERVALEMCPTSNVQTHAVLSYEAHPLFSFLNDGLLVTVNTDNKTVSNTTLLREYAHLRRNGLTNKQQAQLLHNAVFAAFLPEEEKAALLRRMQNATEDGTLP